MLSSKERRKQNKFSKMVAFNNLLKKASNADEEPESDVPEKKVKFSEDQYQDVKRELEEKRRALKNKPKLKLKNAGELAMMSRDLNDRYPIFLDDVYSLALNLYFGSSTMPHNPWRWCHLEKIAKVSQTVLVYVSGISAYEFSSLESRFARCQKIFPVKLEVLLPAQNALERFLNLALVDLDKRDLIRQHGSLDVALSADALDELRPIYPVSSPQPETSEELPAGDKFPRTKLLLSALQMVDEGYPVPVSGDLAYRFSDFRLSKKAYKPVTASSPMFAVDCEMCQTTLGVHEITRVSVVNEQCESVYETFVKPENKITNYMTAYSGITAETLRDVTKTLQEVHEDLEKLLPADAILVGQSLNMDLNCLKLMHPYVIDTSVIFNISGERRSKSKLKTLSREFLGQVIQNHSNGHDSIEDSSASMRLVQLKLSKGVEYGDMVLVNRAKFSQTHDPKKGVPKTVCITASKDCAYDYDAFFRKLSTHPETVENLQIKSFKFTDNEEALQSVAQNCLQYNFITCNVDLSAVEAQQLPAKIEALDVQLDKVFESVAANGCFIVMLGGSAENPKKGVALCRVKE